MIDGQEKGVRLSPPPMCPPGKTLSVLYCGKTTQPLAQPATGRTSGSGIRLYHFLTPAFDPRDVVFLFPAKTCFGKFVTPDVVGAALLTPTPPVPRPPSPASLPATPTQTKLFSPPGNVSGFDSRYRLRFRRADGGSLRALSRQGSARHGDQDEGESRTVSRPRVPRYRSPSKARS